MELQVVVVVLVPLVVMLLQVTVIRLVLVAQV
jgi:hypothetical protein